MAGTFSHKIISSKIDFLVEKRNYVQTFVDETNKVIQLATSWLRNEETTNNLTYTDINKMIESKLDILVNTDFSVSSDEIKTVLSQVNVMQDDMSFLSSSSKNLSEKQLAMEKLVESISYEYSKMEQQKLREIERELESINEKQEKASLQQDQRMTSFEKKIQEVTDSQSDIMENCHQQQSKIREHKKENKKLKTQSQQFTKDLNNALENIHELFALMNVLENQVVDSTQLESSIGSVQGRLENLSLRLEEQDLLLKELTRREEETLNLKQCELEKLEKFEEKISVLEKNWSETLVNSEKSCRDVETKYEMVCQVVADRLLPLERLRDIFNGKKDARTEQIEKLYSVCDQIGDLQSKFTQIEQQTQRPAVGFSALLILDSVKEGTLKFPHIDTNKGNYYDPTTGEFTAPLDGLYAAFLSVYVKADCDIQLSIVKRPCLCEDSCSNCFIKTVCNQKEVEINVSTFGLAELKAGKKLVVVSSFGKEGKKLSLIATFLCFKVY